MSLRAAHRRGNLKCFKVRDCFASLAMTREAFGPAMTENRSLCRAGCGEPSRTRSRDQEGFVIASRRFGNRGIALPAPSFRSDLWKYIFRFRRLLANRGDYFARSFILPLSCYLGPDFVQLLHEFWFFYSQLSSPLQENKCLFV